MTPSPEFLREMSSQLVTARHELAAARARGDEDDVRSALSRIAELDDLLARAVDGHLRTVPALL